MWMAAFLVPRQQMHQSGPQRITDRCFRNFESYHDPVWERIVSPGNPPSGKQTFIIIEHQPFVDDFPVNNGNF